MIDSVFSHGNVNDPIDSAHTLELIAGAGLVVAASYHVNNTQDDVRIDFINGQAGVQLFPCNDTSRVDVAFARDASGGLAMLSKLRSHVRHNVVYLALCVSREERGVPCD